eukprot:GEMP01016991.1.p1 GENE.GEMP01016991.1~~GEMP01016991.1.p1  ORF type:complete len:443 (+),score=88.81 GEMP01016991.1:70-1398(+)
MDTASLLDSVEAAVIGLLKKSRGVPETHSPSHLFHEGAFVHQPWKITFPMMLPSTSPVTHFHGEEIKQRFTFPRPNDISTFLLQFMAGVPLNHECAVILLIYVERLLYQGVQLAPFNWKPVLLAALLVGSKMWEDVPHWNVEFSMIVPEYSIQAINRLEGQFCTMLDFKFHINGADYARYYYTLRVTNAAKTLSYQNQIRWMKDRRDREDIVDECKPLPTSEAINRSFVRENRLSPFYASSSTGTFGGSDTRVTSLNEGYRSMDTTHEHVPFAGSDKRTATPKEEDGLIGRGCHEGTQETYDLCAGLEKHACSSERDDNDPLCGKRPDSARGSNLRRGCMEPASANCDGRKPRGGGNCNPFAVHVDPSPSTIGERNPFNGNEHAGLGDDYNPFVGHDKRAMPYYEERSWLGWSPLAGNDARHTTSKDNIKEDSKSTLAPTGK